MEKLRVGFIGAGQIARMHHLGYSKDPRTTIYAVSDSNQDLLDQRCSEWNVEKTYTDYRHLLDDPLVDIVDVITPHHLHAEMVIAALDAGKHVSVQKPMALNITQANEMVNMANRSDKLFRVIENYRFHSPIVKTKQIIRDGGIGNPISIRMKSISGNARYGWDIPKSSKEWRSDKARAGEGTFVFDHGHHVWALARYFLGDVERVFAFIGQKKVENHLEILPGTILDSPAMVTWKYARQERYGSWEGVDAHEMVVNSDHYSLDLWIEVTGSQGVIWVNHGSYGRMLERPSVELYRDGETTGFNEFNSDYQTSFENAIRDFIDAILEEREADLTGEEARAVLRLALAIVRSGQEHREVRVDEIVD